MVINLIWHCNYPGRSPAPASLPDFGYKMPS